MIFVIWEGVNVLVSETSYLKTLDKIQEYKQLKNAPPCPDNHLAHWTQGRHIHP